jgi:hypothetical protein
MIVIAAIFIGLLIAVLGAVGAGFVALRAVDWYHISGREGASGYFVAAIGLIGIAVGFILGIACGLSMHADTGLGFLKALGLAFAIILFLSSSAGVITRLYADIPPKLGGETMFLMVELKWPPTRTDSPALDPGDTYVTLGSLNGRTLRKSKRGQLWKYESTFVDGHWIARGAVEIFTSRGKRLLEVNLGTPPNVGFLVPLPAYPGKAQESWSDWMPRRFLPTTPVADQLTYRFRVQRKSRPMHVETFGNFEIVTFTSCFSDAWEDGKPRVVSVDRFGISYRGKAIQFSDVAVDSPRVRCLIKLPSTSKSLLALVAEIEGSRALYLLHGLGDQLAVESVVADAGSVAALIPLAPTNAKEPPSLSENRRQIVSDGLYLVGTNTIFDTRTLKVHRYSPIENSDIGDFRPLMLSPDQCSFVRFTFDRNTQAPTLTATDFIADRSYSLPIDRQRMRYVKIEQIDRTWAEHHFKWERDATGVDQLVARTEFSLLPFRGELGPEGDKRSAYYLYGSNESIRSVLEGVLIDKFAAERQPPVEYQVDQRFRVGGMSVKVFASSDIASVSTEDATLMNQIADTLNAELATHKHDALFPIK